MTKTSEQTKTQRTAYIGIGALMVGLALTIWVPEQKALGQQLLWAGVAMIGLPVSAYSISRGLAKSGTRAS